MKTIVLQRYMETLLEFPYERPLEYLHPQMEDIVRYWYMARIFVLDLLNNELQSSNTFPQGWHFVVDGDNSLMLSVVRYIALYAHFSNYEEYDVFGKLSCKNRTLITILSGKKAADIEAELQKEEFLGNLPKHCLVSVYGEVKNAGSYLDIAIDIVKKVGDNKESASCRTVKITEEEVDQFIASKTGDDLFRIDTRKAVYASRIYNLSNDINNIPYEDINCVERYERALNAFQYRVLNSKEKLKLIDEEKRKKSRSEIRSALSNVFCTDCFEIREKEVELIAKQEEKEGKESEIWKKHIEALAHCEHNRWVAEKLILGYEPFGKKERLEYESLFGQQRKKYRDLLKNREASPMHINICSNKELRRIDPDNMKYDSFLMLSVSMILDKIKEDGKKNQK